MVRLMDTIVPAGAVGLESRILAAVTQLPAGILPEALFHGYGEAKGLLQGRR
jgi:hypothetical protein